MRSLLLLLILLLVFMSMLKKKEKKREAEVKHWIGLVVFCRSGYKCSSKNNQQICQQFPQFHVLVALFTVTSSQWNFKTMAMARFYWMNHKINHNSCCITSSFNSFIWFQFNYYFIPVFFFLLYNSVQWEALTLLYSF